MRRVKRNGALVSARMWECYLTDAEIGEIKRQAKLRGINAGELVVRAVKAYGRFNGTVSFTSGIGESEVKP